MRRDQGLGLLGSASLWGPFQSKDVLEAPQVPGSGCNCSAPYLNLYGLFCPSFSIMQLPHLSHPPCLTKGEGDFQGRVYKFFFKSSANSSGLALTFAKPHLVVHASCPCPTFPFYSAIFNSSESPGKEPGVWRAQLAVPGCHCLAKQIPCYSAGLLGYKT